MKFNCGGASLENSKDVDRGIVTQCTALKVQYTQLIICQFPLTILCHFLNLGWTCAPSQWQRWRQGRNAGGAKTVRLPTASEASKIFTDHTFKIGLKCNFTL